MDIKDIFPLKAKEEGCYLGMGEYGSKYEVLLNNGKSICSTDYMPNYIEDINNTVEKLKQQRDIYKEHWIKQLDQMLNEFDKDGWCRLVMKKDEVLQMKKEMETDYGIFD